MSGFKLDPGTHIGRVHLQVSNLQRSLDFYQNKLGFRLVSQNGKNVALSATGTEPTLIMLTEILNAIPRPKNTTGLYHVAIRLPGRAELAQVFRHLLNERWPFQGFADHSVSEALYLADPDSNGLELYADRPRDVWWGADGKIKMGVDPLDIKDLLSAGDRPWTGIDPGTDIGHIHLQVSDLARSEAFYAGLIGLDVIEPDYPGALFLSAGGYHHHLGMNTWTGINAPPPPPNAVGLISFSLSIPEKDNIHDLLARVLSTGTKLERSHDESFLIRDPDGNGVDISINQ